MAADKAQADCPSTEGLVPWAFAKPHVVHLIINPLVTSGVLMPKANNSSHSVLQVVGHSVIRTDARAKVTGEAQFSADRMPADGLLYGKTLRSPHPYAEIVDIDTAKAVGLPGVRAVVTFRDAPENPFEDGDAVHRRNR